MTKEVYTLNEPAERGQTRSWEGNKAPEKDGYYDVNLERKLEKDIAVYSGRVQNTRALVSFTDEENGEKNVLAIVNKRGISFAGGKVENESEKEDQKYTAKALQEKGYNKQETDQILAATRELKEETGLDIRPELAKNSVGIRVNLANKREELGVPEGNKATTESATVEFDLGVRNKKEIESSLRVSEEEQSKVFAAIVIKQEQLGIDELEGGKKKPKSVALTEEQKGQISEENLKTLEKKKAFDEEGKVKADFVSSVFIEEAKKNPIDKQQGISSQLQLAA